MILRSGSRDRLKRCLHKGRGEEMKETIFRMAAAIALAGTGFLPAQSPVGNIAGVVRDASGSAIAGATATAINQAVGSTRSATTDTQGDFLMSTLQTGTYQVKVDYKGF